jgi:hypothetical protein
MPRTQVAARTSILVTSIMVAIGAFVLLDSTASGRGNCAGNAICTCCDKVIHIVPCEDCNWNGLECCLWDQNPASITNCVVATGRSAGWLTSTPLTVNKVLVNGCVYKAGVCSGPPYPQTCSWPGPNLSASCTNQYWQGEFSCVR